MHMHIPDQRVSPPDLPDLTPLEEARHDLARLNGKLDAIRAAIRNACEHLGHARAADVEAFFAAELARDEAREAFEDESKPF